MKHGNLELNVSLCVRIVCRTCYYAPHHTTRACTCSRMERQPHICCCCCRLTGAGQEPNANKAVGDQTRRLADWCQLEAQVRVTAKDQEARVRSAALAAARTIHAQQVAARSADHEAEAGSASEQATESTATMPRLFVSNAPQKMTFSMKF